MTPSLGPVYVGREHFRRQPGLTTSNPVAAGPLNAARRILRRPDEGQGASSRIGQAYRSVAPEGSKRWYPLD
jgi:hypothetical protein